MEKLVHKVINLLAKVNFFHEKKPLIVLNYHSILDMDESNDDWIVSTDSFSSQMEYLFKINIKVSLLRDIKELSLKNSTQDQIVYITFDDGLENNFINAIPILRKYNFKASFFIVGNSLIGDCNYPKWLSSREMSNYPKFMSHTQLKEVHADGHEIGSHAMTHIDLNESSDEIIKNELVESKDTIERSLFEDCKGFVIPFGISGNIDKERVVKDLCRNNNYKYACLGKYGYIDRRVFDIYDIPRIPVYGFDNLSSFTLKVKGKYNFVSHIYRFRKYIRSHFKV